MGWLWTCLGSHKSAQQGYRLDGRGSLSFGGNTLPAQYHKGTNGPHAEDFLQPRRRSGEDEVLPVPLTGTSATTRNSGGNGKSSKSSTPRASCSANGKSSKSSTPRTSCVNLKSSKNVVGELKEELELLKAKLAAEAAEAEKLREEVNYLRSCQINALDNRGKSLDREGLIADGPNVRRNWYPSIVSLYDKSDDKPPSTRKSFSELLMETNSDGSSRAVKGPLALAAMAAVTGRAAKNQFVPTIVSLENNQSIGDDKDPQCRQYGSEPRTSNVKMNPKLGSGQKNREGCGPLVNLLLEENESISKKEQQMLLSISRPGGRHSWESATLSLNELFQQDTPESEELNRPFTTTSTDSEADNDEALDIEWIEIRGGDTSGSSTQIERAEDDAESPQTSGFLLNVASERDYQKGWKRQRRRLGRQDSFKKRSRNPLSPHFTPLLNGTSDYKLSEPGAVTAFRGGRVQLHLADSSIHQILPNVSVSRSSLNVGNLFRSSKKRTLPIMFRALRRPLSPVPETLSLSEGSWSLQCCSSNPRDLSSRLSLTNGLEGLAEREGAHSIPFWDTSAFVTGSQGRNRQHSDLADSLLRNTSFSFKSTDKYFSNIQAEPENQEHEHLAPLDYSYASYVAINRPTKRRHASSGIRRIGSTRWTLTDDSIDLHPSNESSCHLEKMESNKCRKEKDTSKPEAPPTSEIGIKEEIHDALRQQTLGSQVIPEVKCRSNNSKNSESSRGAVSRFAAEDEKQRVGEHREELPEQEFFDTSKHLIETDITTPEVSRNVDDTKQTTDSGQKLLRVSNQVQYWNSLQNVAEVKEDAKSATPKSEETTAKFVKMWNAIQRAAASKEKPDATTQRKSSSLKSGAIIHEAESTTSSSESGCSRLQHEESTPSEATTNGSLDAPRDSSSSTGGTTDYQNEEATASFRRTFSTNRSGDPSLLQFSSDEGDSHENGQVTSDTVALQPPQRQLQVAPEVFISPIGANNEGTLTRLFDIKPEERPIFGSVAGHWEAAWSTKRQTWDGKGIPNSTNKYKEDQKVNWHATPFEERVVQALATQADGSPRKAGSMRINLNASNDGGMETRETNQLF